MKRISELNAFILMITIIIICSIIDKSFPSFPAIGVAGGACFAIGGLRKK